MVWWTKGLVKVDSPTTSNETILYALIIDKVTNCNFSSSYCNIAWIYCLHDWFGRIVKGIKAFINFKYITIASNQQFPVCIIIFNYREGTRSNWNIWKLRHSHVLSLGYSYSFFNIKWVWSCNKEVKFVIIIIQWIWSGCLYNFDQYICFIVKCTCYCLVWTKVNCGAVAIVITLVAGTRYFSKVPPTLV